MKITVQQTAAIQAAADEIWKFITTGWCVGWIGSGLSVPCGYPSWEQAVERLCVVCLVGKNVPATNDPARLIDLAEDCRQANRDVYFATLAELYGNTTIQVPVTYVHLGNLPLHGLVTTNIDPLLYQSTGPRRLIAYPEGLYLSDVTPEAVVYLHGIARRNGKPDGSRVVFSRTEFENAYSRHSLPDCLAQMLGRYRTLFIGCRLGEKYIDDIFQRVKRIYDAHPEVRRTERRILLADSVDDAFKKAQESRLAQIGITVIRYPAIDQDHIGLAEVLENVRARRRQIIEERHLETERPVL